MHSRLHPVLLTSIFVFLLALPAHAKENYVSLVNEAYPADGPGAAFLVSKDGDVLFRGARGMADLELDVALTAESVFRLGSITKQFTAAAIMMLANEGKLSIKSEITKFLPDFPTHGRHVTVEHLLNHTSGIFSYTSIPGYMMSGKIRNDLSTDELVDVFDDFEMEFSPGEQWRYSNSGYVLLGAIIERVSGLSYADFIEQRIFEPLGMENSHYGGMQLVPRRVEGYMGQAGEYRNAPFLSMTQPHAAGSLLSTVDDLARWQKGLFAGAVIPADSLAAMTTKAKLNDGEEVDYGFGFELSSVRGARAIHHGGGIFGFATHMMWLPESKVFVAVLSNSPQNPVSPTMLASQLAAEAIGDPFPQRMKVELSADQLSDYVGVYQADEETTRSVTLDGNRLSSQRSGGPAFEIHPYGDDSFFYEGSLTYVVFTRDESGRVVAMHMHQGGEAEAQVSPRIKSSRGGQENGVGNE